MFTLTPEAVIRIAGNGSVETIEAFGLMRSDLEYKLENREAQPTENDYQRASEFLTGETGIVLDIDAVKALLSLYPAARISLANDDLDDDFVRDRLKDAVADAFVNCRWPRHDDEVDLDAFASVLHAQAEELGYGVLFGPPEPQTTFHFD
ncbi:hypothetical protein [Rhizobium sp. WYCCWR 11146]|uniref:hypothetical protein n=1 Tax=Rhizobium sp. WYCCWR 11146 TaxID=2749833 RepID=UPI0015E65954|nr:hypothetical protein [Rhizobium sp. WYCCWR 11146]MBA1343898.1 hypothetical protein [Rhizobium sp. WYCCWR 11146]